MGSGLIISKSPTTLHEHRSDEGASAHQIRKQLDINPFGSVRAIRAVLAHFRSRTAEVIVNVSCDVGRMSMPGQSLYNTSNWTPERFSGSLHSELRPLGISVKVVESRGIRTNFFNAVQHTDVDDLPSDQPYQDTVLHTHTELNADRAEPDMVAEVIFDGPTDADSSQLRDRAGLDASLFLTLRKLLPDRLFFWLVRSHLEPA